MTRTLCLSSMVLCGWAAWAQTGPSASPATLSFSYQVGTATLPASAKLTASLPSTASSTTIINAAAVSTGWLIVTPASGHSPLALAVTVNPTGMAPGSYVGSINLTTTPVTSTTSVVVSFSISNPPSTLVVTSPESNYTPTSGSSSGTLTFSYTTGTSWTDPQSEVDVASNGGVIDFNVTAAVAKATGGGTSTSTVWLRLSTQKNALVRSVQTSGVANSGSTVPVWVSLDQTTVQSLLPGSYGGTIAIAATNPVHGSQTVAVNLVVLAGAPNVTDFFPHSLVQAPAVPPVLTISGLNFFTTSVVTMAPPKPGFVEDGTTACVPDPSATSYTLTPQLLSQQIVQATVSSAYVKSPSNWCVCVTNPAPPDNPVQVTACSPWEFKVLSTSAMAIQAVVNAASYLQTATQAGTDKNPVGAKETSVAPGEIISIFGQNLGPTGVFAVPPVKDTITSWGPLPASLNTLGLAVPLAFNVDATNVTVDFSADPKKSAAELLADIVAYINGQTQTAVGANLASVAGNAIQISVDSITPTPALTMTDNAASQLLKLTTGNGDITDGFYPTMASPPLPTGSTDTQSNISVVFQYKSVSNAAVTVSAPIIMVSSNQINAVVPFEIAGIVGTAQNKGLSVQVWNNADHSDVFPLTAINADPGIFTLTGLGTGQGAVLNYESASGAYTINSSKNSAQLGSTIVIYATGLGNLTTVPPLDGSVANSTLDPVQDPVQVSIGGQPAVVSYKGSAPGSVAGLVQINAIVPPTVAPAANVSLSVSSGTAATARRSQAGVTLAVKK